MAQRPVRTFYCILEGPSPTLRDFTSFHALGRPLRRQTPELLRRWSGISVYETEEQARVMAIGRPSIGAFIATVWATVSIEVDAPIQVEQTGDPDSGHYMLWGDPASFLARVVSIAPVCV